MYQFFIILNVLSIFLSVLAAPLPSDRSLNKRWDNGRGTWFYDGLGACGDYNINSDSIVAVSHLIYNGGEYCNRWVSITNTVNGKQAYGLVRDECQSCGENDLDMSQGLFEQLGLLATGVLNIDWHFMSQGWSP